MSTIKIKCFPVSILAEYETAITLLGSSLQDNEKRTPLHAAAYLGDAEILELLILSGTVIIEEKDYTDFCFDACVNVIVSLILTIKILCAPNVFKK